MSTHINFYSATLEFFFKKLLKKNKNKTIGIVNTNTIVPNVVTTTTKSEACEPRRIPYCVVIAICDSKRTRELMKSWCV
ncbi:hypothetical protein DOY81_014020 [Sarcophaga bullata]|nr:hypothetical protein DOY81_014020 [Sarcophaga bullata]